MSVEAVSAVLNHSATKGSTRAVAVAMANRADEHGLCFPSVRDTAKRANCSARTVQYALRRMEEMGELVILAGAEGGRKRTPLYYFNLPGLDGELSDDHNYFLRQKGAKLAPQPKEGRAQSAQPKGAGSGTERAQTVAPESSKEPSSKSSNTQSGGHGKVNRKPVTDSEYALAEQIVAAFNAAADTAVTVDAHLTPLVGRVREKADLTAEDHRGIIAAVFAGDRWWTGPPSPAIIYGSAAQFERSIEVWRAKPASASHLSLVKDPPPAEEIRGGLKEARPAWDAARARLAEELPDSTFRLWIEPLVLAGADDSTFYFAAPDGVRAWSERRYASLLAEALTEAEGAEVKVSFAAEMPRAA